MEYTLKRRKHMQTVRVRVEPSGEVVVSAPFGVPKSVIMSFVLQHSHWITRQQEKIKLRSDVFPVLDWERMVLSYLGNLYTITFNPAQQERVKVGKQYLYVNPVTGLESHLKRTLLRWLKQQAQHNITQRVHHWSNVMQCSFSTLGFRQQKSRWGSCGPKNELSFNWRLIHFKPEVIDYVVIHEIAHTKHHDHSQRFWRMVEQFDPSFRQKVAFLKKQNLVLERI